MKNVLILEDYELHRNILKKLLDEIDDVWVYLAETKEEAYQIALENTIDVFLIDIILDTGIRGDISGLIFSETIRKIPKYSFVPLIFITSLEDPQFYAYKELHCFGYIEKPFAPEQVKNLIQKALKFPELKENENDTERTLYFRIEGIIYAVKSKDIVYIETGRRYLTVHTTDGILKVPYKTGNQILKELNSPDFIQCSRYTIINKQFIESIDPVNRYIKMKGIEESVELGASMKKRFLDEFSN